VALVQGYIIRLIRFKILNPDSFLPNWDEWAELLVSGFSWLAIQTLFWLIYCVLTASYLLGLAIAISAGSKFAIPIATAGGAMLSLLFLAYCFLMPFLMVNMAVEERISAGLNVGAVLKRFASDPKEFISAWLLCAGISGVAFILPVSTIVLSFVAPSSIFFGQALAAAIMAQVWGRGKIDRSELL